MSNDTLIFYWNKASTGVYLINLTVRSILYCPLGKPTTVIYVLYAVYKYVTIPVMFLNWFTYKV